MKKLLLIAIIGLLSLAPSIAQTINGTPIKDIDVEFIQIVGTSKLMSKKVTIEIDFGQFNSIWKQKDTQMLDKDGKKLVFNSMIDALNFWNENGYEFIDANAMAVGNVNVYHYLLRNTNN